MPPLPLVIWSSIEPPTVAQLPRASGAVLRRPRGDHGTARGHQARGQCPCGGLRGRPLPRSAVSPPILLPFFRFTGLSANLAEHLAYVRTARRCVALMVGRRSVCANSQDENQCAQHDRQQLQLSQHAACPNACHLKWNTLQTGGIHNTLTPVMHLRIMQDGDWVWHDRKLRDGGD